MIGTKFAAGAIVVLILISAFLGWRYRAQIAEIATLQANAVQYRAALDQTQKSLDEALAEQARTEQLLAARERERNRIARQAEAMRAELDQLRAIDHEVDEWAGQRMPAAVTERLRDFAGRH